MKMQVALLVALTGLLLVGRAVADIADVPPPTHAQTPPKVTVGQLLALGEQLVGRVAVVSKQLALSLEKARATEDVLLATCLESKVDELARIHTEASLSVNKLRLIAYDLPARSLYVTMMVLEQKATFVMEEAALCVGANEHGQSFADGISAPYDPEAGLPEAAPATEPPVPSPFAALPPPMRAKVPIAMPPIPPVASPVR
jgi:hypothetical protein